MDAQSFIDLQEALIYVFAPVVINILLVFLIGGGALSAIGVIALDLASRISR